MNGSSVPLVIYVDVDDTFVRSYGTKRIPIPAVIRHVQNLWREGADLYCWSSGGANYAEESALEFGIHKCFKAFLPKPNVLLDDQEISEWRRFMEVHPGKDVTETVAGYRATLSNLP